MDQPPLKKALGLWPAVSIIIGSIIGSGVFMKPATMASQLGSPLWLAAVWIIAGIFSLTGALIYAEVGAMLPETGGQYVYFKHMYGKFVAFLYGWGRHPLASRFGKECRKELSLYLLLRYSHMHRSHT